MGVALHLNNLESLSLEAAYCEAWINLPSSSAEGINILSMYFLLLSNYLPLEKRRSLSIEQLLPHSPKYALC